MSTLGSCFGNFYGYNLGQPCIYLKLNRIYGVENVYYNDTSDLPDDMPDSLKAHIAKQADKNQVILFIFTRKC